MERDRPPRVPRRAGERQTARPGPPHGVEPGHVGASDPSLRSALRRIDREPYGAYRRLLGVHRVGEFEVTVDHVPPDPFSGMARVRVAVDRRAAGLPDAEIAEPCRRLALEDFVARSAAAQLARLADGGAWKVPGAGGVVVEPPGPAIIERSTCRISWEAIEIRVFVDLPAVARRVRGGEAEHLLLDILPRFVSSVLLFSSQRLDAARLHANVVEDHAAIVRELRRRGLVGFVADGSVLPRASAEDRAPRRDGREVPFETPESLGLTLDLPHAGSLRGMGIPAGVTLLVGGAFHGKSTLLEAIARGVHPHPPGDGRERVAAIPESLAIRAEPGRSVRRVDLAMFFADLPDGTVPSDLTAERAGGSTSQAATLAEAIESGARLLLIDEDSSASSFLIRDARMQRLVPRPGESIVPLVDRIREIYEGLGVSAIVATGGSGDFLEAAHTVIRMNAYRAEDATAQARDVVAATRSMRLRETLPGIRPPAPRFPSLPGGIPVDEKCGPRGSSAIRMGADAVDLSAVGPTLEAGQLRALARILRDAASRMDGAASLEALLDHIEERLDATGIDGLDSPPAYDLARPRRFEIAAAINRWRRVAFRRPDR